MNCAFTEADMTALAAAFLLHAETHHSKEPYQWLNQPHNACGSLSP
jgi:hypothetical protein